MSNPKIDTGVVTVPTDTPLVIATGNCDHITIWYMAAIAGATITINQGASSGTYNATPLITTGATSDGNWAKFSFVPFGTASAGVVEVGTPVPFIRITAATHALSVRVIGD